MTLEHDLKCDECGKIFNGSRVMHRDPEASYRILCSGCLENVEKIAKRKWLKKLREGKTLEQRVVWLEEWIYYTTEELNKLNGGLNYKEKK